VGVTVRVAKDSIRETNASGSSMTVYPCPLRTTINEEAISHTIHGTRATEYDPHQSRAHPSRAGPNANWLIATSLFPRLVPKSN
jgi:hypothetical protein